MQRIKIDWKSYLIGGLITIVFLRGDLFDLAEAKEDFGKKFRVLSHEFLINPVEDQEFASAYILEEKKTKNCYLLISSRIGMGLTRMD